MKTLRYFFAAAMAVVGMSSFAQTEFDFANANDLFNHPGSSSGSGSSYVADGEFTTDATATIGDFSVTVSASDAEATTKNRIWTTAPRLRMYNGTLTIKSAGASMTSIVFTCGTSASNSKWNDGNTASVGNLTVEKPTITWAGESKEVVINIAGNTQFTKLVITAGEAPATETVWDFTILPTETIDGTGNITTNAAGGVFTPGDESTNWQAFNNNGAIEGAEFMATATQALEMTKGLKWYINGANKVYYRNYPVEGYGGKYIFINDGDNATEVCIPAKAGQQIVLTAGTAKNNKKVTSDDVAETFETSEGETLHGVVIDGTTKYDWKEYTLTVTHNDPFLKFEKNMCIQKITVKDASGIAAVKAANKVANNQMYNLAGQKVGKDYKGIVIVNGKKMLNK